MKDLLMQRDMLLEALERIIAYHDAVGRVLTAEDAQIARAAICAAKREISDACLIAAAPKMLEVLEWEVLYSTDEYTRARCRAAVRAVIRAVKGEGT